MARPTFTPSDEQRMQVGIMAACGFAHELICERVINPTTGKKIDTKTLRKAFRKELDEGMSQANAMVAQSLFKKAIGTGTSAVTAAIWWEKTRGGMKDQSAVEVTGKNGAPLHPQTAVDMTDEELENIARAGRAGTAAAP